MGKITKIFLTSLCICGALGFIGFWLLIFGMIRAMGPAPKPPIGIVGGEIAKDTNEYYNFAKNRTNLVFPNGTEIDAAPGGWSGVELTCFTIPKKDIDSFLISNKITLSQRDKSKGLQEAVDVSEKNQKLPPDTQLAIQENPPKTKEKKYFGYELYFHKQSGRLWVVCHVKAPYD